MLNFAILNLLFIFSSFSFQAHAYYPNTFDESLTSIAFGSCNFQRRDQTHWNIISQFRPDLWIWAGDNIYADHLPLTLKENEYRHLRENVFYKSFRENTPIIGTWDDHDFSSNSAGSGALLKPQQQRLALNFLDEPPSSLRRNQQGIYTTYLFGSGWRSVRIILLDVRYFREEPGTGSSILGETQWKWLESTLKSNRAALTFIVSGTQVFPFESGGDSWQRDYPQDFQRLAKLLGNHLAPIIILSGDRHFAEISKATLHSFFRMTSVLEFTASGMTHSTDLKTSLNRYRISRWMSEKNFGLIKLNWNTWPRTATLEIRRIDGSLFDSHTLEF